MKRLIVTVTAALAFSATTALAATPAAPVMSMTVKTTKVAEGTVEAWNGGRELAIDGNNVYVAYDGSDGASVIRSTDGGLTWGVPAVLSIGGGSTRIALAKDPLSTTKKIIAATYETGDGNIYYRYYVDRPSGAVWSQPVVIGSGLAFTVAMTAAPNGSIHVLYCDTDWTTVYYTTASSADASFSTPVALSWPAFNGEIAIATDSANNLYSATALYGTDNTVHFHKKANGSSSWSDVTVVASGASNAASIAALDSNNIYIAYKMMNTSVPTNGPNMWLAVTNDGGKTWTKRILPSHSAQDSSRPSIAVNSSKVVSVAAAYNAHRANAFVAINKSSDNGATWSPDTIVAGSHFASLAIDSAGKTCIVSGIWADVISASDIAFRNGADAQPWGTGARPIYFSREK
jgi:hypothetical protein